MKKRAGPYQLFMLGLCIYALAALAATSLGSLSGPTLRVLEAADLVVCLFFLIDFVQCLARAQDRKSYMLRWGWIDLLSSIPSRSRSRIRRTSNP